MLIQYHVCPTYYEFVRQVPSDQRNGTVYTVIYGVNLNKYGEATLGWHCTCPDFEFRAQAEGRVCKHIQAVRAERCGWSSVETGEDPLQMPDTRSVLEYRDALDAWIANPNNPFPDPPAQPSGEIYLCPRCHKQGIQTPTVLVTVRDIN